MDRRNFLMATVTAGIIGTAGCNESQSKKSTDRDESLQPESVTHSPTHSQTRTPTRYPTNSPTPKPTPPQTPERTFDHYVQRTGRHFTIDGEAFYTNGANNQFPYNFPQEWTRELFTDAESMGLTSFRIECAIGHGETQLQTGPGEYNEQAFQELDFVIEEAEKHGLRIILVLTDYWSPGGIQSYVNWADSATHRYEFYTNDECQRMFRSFIRHLLERTNTRTGRKYKDDPTIMMFELMNEPQLRSNADQDPKRSDLKERERKLQGWIESTSQFIKSVDSHHLVSTGIEGFYNEKKAWMDGEWYVKLAQDFIENHQPQSIDACSMHLYPETFVNDDRCTPEKNCLETLEYHVVDGHEKIGKPVYLGEFGYPVDRLADDADRQMKTRNQLLARWYDKLANLEADGAHLWILYPHQWKIGDGGHGTYYVIFEEDLGTRKIITEYSRLVNGRSGHVV